MANSEYFHGNILSKGEQHAGALLRYKYILFSLASVISHYFSILYLGWEHLNMVLTIQCHF